MNLLPEKAHENGNYFCTWGLQSTIAQQLGVKGNNIPEKQRDVLTTDLLFQREDLYHLYDREDRAGLYFLLDDGWDVPFHTNSAKGTEMFGSLIPDAQKFPGLGDTPVERLRALVHLTEELGYAGLGLWVSPQEVFEPEHFSWERARAYWEERARWCHEAGVKYWKVDWGRHITDMEYREMMTACARRCAPGLLIEHAVAIGPFSEYPDQEALASKMQNCLVCSDFLRTYDVSQPFLDVETFFRVHTLLKGFEQHKARHQTKGHINVEFCAAIAAGLGLNLGIMRYQPELRACIRWQRLAPPFSAYGAPYLCSSDQVTDQLIFDQNPVWWLSNRIGTSYQITVPAVASRGTALPIVEADGEPPIVLASQHPETRAYALSILRRNIDPNPGVALLADITIMPSDMHAPIGVFGRCRKLTIRFGAPVPAGISVWAQCLLNEEAADVTSQVRWLEDGIEIDGRLLRIWGHDRTDPCAVHEPAVLLKLC